MAGLEGEEQLLAARSDPRVSELRTAYLRLLRSTLTYSLWPETFREVTGHEVSGPQARKRALYSPVRRLLATRNLVLMKRVRVDLEKLEDGREFPQMAHTMAGTKRLLNLEGCIEDVLCRRVPGDFIEAGVWRGGTSIFMRGVLRAHGVTDRTVYLADSFKGHPEPKPKAYPADRHARWHRSAYQNVSIDEVRDNFERYGLLDDQVVFLPGWFQDSLPAAPLKSLAVIRIDAVTYESTTMALEHLYPKLSVGGYVLLDDYGSAVEARAAVDDYRKAVGLEEQMREVDWTEVYWQRTR